MKSITRSSIVLLSFVFVLISCDNDGPDTSIDSVKSLIYPLDNYSVELQSTGNDIVFEWEEVKENGILYQIAFDHSSGDFSNPVYIMNSDNNGGSSSVSLSQKDLNKIARLMGLKSSETGSFKWSVISIRGLTTMKAAQEHTITVKRMSGFDNLPLAVYLSGAGSEAGANISDALIMQRIEDGVFEIYSQLKEGQPYGFVNEKTSMATKFYYDGEVIREGDVTMTVPKTGIYHINLDFTTGSASYREILRVALFHNANQVYLWLPYQGYGVWGSGFELTEAGIFNNTEVAETNANNRPSGNPVTSNLGTDDRYKFRMGSRQLDSEDEVITEWRTLLANDNKPGGSPKPEWYHMIERSNVEQWTNNQIWKIQPGAWMGITIDVTFELKGDAPYTHTFVVK